MISYILITGEADQVRIKIIVIVRYDAVLYNTRNGHRVFGLLIIPPYEAVNNYLATNESKY
jgi:hypothetical protein